MLYVQISDEDNEVLTPLIESLQFIEDFDAKFDMIDSPLKVKMLLKDSHDKSSCQGTRPPSTA